MLYNNFHRGGKTVKTVNEYLKNLINCCDNNLFRLDAFDFQSKIESDILKMSYKLDLYYKSIEINIIVYFDPKRKNFIFHTRNTYLYASYYDYRDKGGDDRETGDEIDIVPLSFIRDEVKNNNIRNGDFLNRRAQLPLAEYLARMLEVANSKKAISKLKYKVG